MKNLRWITLLIVATLIFSAWAPAPVLAKAETATISSESGAVSVSVAPATAKQVKLTVVNQTGGVIYLTLTGTRSYYFVAGEEGKNVFMIDNGKYTVTLRTSACSGSVTRKINGGGNLGTFRCFKNK
jgi:hypothetical protein